MCSSLDANLSSWNTSQVSDMSAMFDSVLLFPGVGIESMMFMFLCALAINSNLSAWNTSNVDDMLYMFKGACSFRGYGIDHWSTVKTMFGMFAVATLLNVNVSSWHVGNVKDMGSMFLGANLFVRMGLSNWDASQVPTTAYMFANTVLLNANLLGWNVFHAGLLEMQLCQSLVTGGGLVTIN
jgi:surface protein